MTMVLRMTMALGMTMVGDDNGSVVIPAHPQLPLLSSSTFLIEDPGLLLFPLLCEENNTGSSRSQG